MVQVGQSSLPGKPIEVGGNHAVRRPAAVEDALHILGSSSVEGKVDDAGVLGGIAVRARLKLALDWKGHAEVDPSEQRGTLQHPLGRDIDLSCHPSLNYTPAGAGEELEKSGAEAVGCAGLHSASFDRFSNGQGELTYHPVHT